MRTQEPPNTCHLSTFRCSRIFSMSFTRSQVVFSSRFALLQDGLFQHSGQSTIISVATHGVDFPEPRWSKRTIYYKDSEKVSEDLDMRSPFGVPCTSLDRRIDDLWRHSLRQDHLRAMTKPDERVPSIALTMKEDDCKVLNEYIE